MSFTSPDFWIALLQIIGVNIVLSGDNAVVIALAARSLPAAQQKKAVAWGSGAAVVMRIVLTIVAVELLRLPYLKLVGGRYIGHGPLERFRVEVVDRQHPVTQGVEDFSVADEQHTPPYDESKVHLLLRNRSDDGQTAAAGWAYEPGQGRLCHLANGHTREALEHPMYQRLLQNATRWCLRMPPIDPNQTSQ